MGIVEELIKKKRETDTLNIRSKDELISACNAAGIPKEWYSFTYSDDVLVCKNNDTIYYGNHGQTSNSREPERLYANMYYELLNYKKIAEWEAQGIPYRLLGIEVKLHYRFNKDPDKEYPYVIARTEAGDNDLANKVALGWKNNGYDRYMGWYYLTKVDDIRNLIKNIVIIFDKKTTDEDKVIFGFSSDYMTGAYSYEVPSEMSEEIAKSLYDNNGTVSKEIKDKIFSHFSEAFILDEFKGLCAMKNDYERAIENFNREIGQSDEQAKKKLGEQFRTIWDNNPSHLNCFDCRSEILENFYYDKAYEILGLERKPKTGRNCENNWKSFLHNN